MEKAKEIKGAITAFIAVLTAFWGLIGWAVVIFIASMLLDYLTGSWAAIASGEWSSARARAGLRGKLGEIVALLVAALCDIAISVILKTQAVSAIGDVAWSDFFTLLVCFWYIFTELGSIIENAGKLGAPVPGWLIKGIRVLRAKIDMSVEKKDDGEDAEAGE